MNCGLKIGAGQRSRSMALAKWIAASGDENGIITSQRLLTMHKIPLTQDTSYWFCLKNIHVQNLLLVETET